MTKVIRKEAIAKKLGELAGSDRIGKLEIHPNFSRSWPTHRLAARLLKLGAHLTELRIEPQPPKSLDCDVERLLFFYAGAKDAERVSRMNSLRIGGSGYQIDVGINWDSIRDLKLPADGNRLYTLDLPYCVIGVPRGNKGACELKGTIKIEFERSASPPPEIVKIDKVCGEVIPYKHGSTAKVARVILRNPSPIMFSDPATGKLVVRAVDSTNEDLSGHFYFADAQGQPLPGGTVQVDAGRETAVLLCLSFAELKNPSGKRHVTLQPLVADSDQASVEPLQIKFGPDPQLTDLGFRWSVGIREEDWREELLADQGGLNGFSRKSKNPVNVPLESRATAGGGSDKIIQVIRFEIGNKATAPEPKGSVTIRDFRIGHTMESKDGKTISMPAGLIREDYQDNINLSDSAVGKVNGSQPSGVTLSFMPEKAFPVFRDHDEVTCQLQISFDYAVEQEVEQARPSGRVEFRYEFKLRRRVGSVLALDFGTAAIAASLRASGSTPELLNLSEIRRAEIEASGEPEPSFPEDDTPYLSSQAFLKYKEDEIEESSYGTEIISFTDGFVGLAPSGRISTNRSYPKKVLPHLKALVGYRSVPFRPFGQQYRIEGKLRDNIPVPLVMRQSYKKLIRNYIIPAIKNAVKVDQESIKSTGEILLLSTFGNILLTIPNNFNPAHMAAIKKLLLEEISWRDVIDDPQSHLYERNSVLFFDDGIRFVSESEAVLLYYVENLRQGSLGVGREHGEKVLVYDIGAGTLDISYALLSSSSDRKKIIVTELGRLGESRAGNAIDTILAMSLCVNLAAHKGSEEGKKLAAELFQAPDKHSRLDWVDLLRIKEFFQLGYKPLLGEKWNTSATKFEFGDSHAWEPLPNSFVKMVDRSTFVSVMGPAALSRSRPFVELMQSLTNGVIRKLERIVPRDELESGRLRVDRVILSGRTAQFTPLISELKKALAETVDMPPDDQYVPLTGNTAKEGVVRGALSVLADHIEPRGQKLHAWYGLIYRSSNTEDQRFSFECLFGPDTNLDKLQPGDVLRHSCDLNLSIAESVVMVQSYVPDPQKDFARKRSTSFSRMLDVSKEYLSAVDDLSRVPCVAEFNPEDFTMKINIAGVMVEVIASSLAVDENYTYEVNTWPYNSMNTLYDEVCKMIDETAKQPLPVFDDDEEEDEEDWA